MLYNFVQTKNDVKRPVSVQFGNSLLNVSKILRQFNPSIIVRKTIAATGDGGILSQKKNHRRKMVMNQSKKNS